MLRYQVFASDQLNNALESVTAAQEAVGNQNWKLTLKENKGFALLLADSMLVRDQIQASMK